MKGFERIKTMEMNHGLHPTTPRLRRAGRLAALTLALISMTTFAATPQITNVKAQQRYPWNGKVDVTFEVVGDVTAGNANHFSLSATDRVTGSNYVAVASALTGDIGTAEGTHHVIWDMSAQGFTFKSSDVVFKVSYTASQSDSPLYCVIDLSAGANASSYPVTYMDAPPSGGFNTDEYKTTKLVLRRIDPGAFKMGIGEYGDYDDDLGYIGYDVTLTRTFYMGIFEVTQRQYELVMGEWPSYFSNSSYYASRPVENVSYNMIRGETSGADWPASSAVDASSFMGKLRSRTGIDGFDLPTEAQWEYACRAGTTNHYNSGKNYVEDYQDSAMDEVGRYWCNGGEEGDDRQSASTAAGTAKAGSYRPNAWGLYDMHGNVWEWCLDWDGELSNGMTEPKGASDGWGRMLRGGSWRNIACECTSSYRLSNDSSSYDNNIGFRLTRTMPAKSYIVTFNANGGRVGEPSRLAENGLAVGVMPNPTRAGYMFTGWFTNMSGGTPVSSTTMVTGHVTYYAQWMEINATDGARYCVIDLSAGAGASAYPVTYVDTPPNGGFNTEEFKTSKLVLRRIDPGSFRMGVGEYGDYDDDLGYLGYNVTLTKAFYMGVFEVTQRQYELVTGTRPSYFANEAYYATRPVDQVSYDMIRGSSSGADWPTSSAVDSSSFMGKLRARTGISGFDLPTEAQWEFACRAGTTSAYNNGGDSEDDLKRLGRYSGNCDYSISCDEQCMTATGTSSVGSYQPNAWGLYDMHGNVWERCLDWDGYCLSDDAADPAGPSSGSCRVERGGSWCVSECESFRRNADDPSAINADDGFRLVIRPPSSIYTVTFDANGGEVSETTRDVEGGLVIGELPMPTCSDYTFAGWYTAAEGGIKVTPDTTVGSTVTFYAHWTANSASGGSLYCVIDLSAGANASLYPVTYMDAPPSGGFNNDEYKTTKLVLRRIEAGTFIMGSDQSDETHRVALTKPFYCGIFEVTQKQYELVMGGNSSAHTGDKRPVDSVSYNTIRGSSSGAGWPSSSNVDDSSFIGKLRARTGQDFDLPTEAQWEYACRAGTTSKYHNGGDSEDDLKLLGRYKGNQSDGKGGYSTYHTTVGSYQPNAWGLYDMHGNVYEWCLDWYGTQTYGTDPVGPSSGSERMKHGGSWYYVANSCTSFHRGGDATSSTTSEGDGGFRIVRTLTGTGLQSQVTVTFNANGGSSSVPSVTRDYGSTLGTLPTATRTGYTFSGWWTVATGGTQVTAPTIVMSNVTYYAHWTTSDTSGYSLYCVIDLSAGANASLYPVTYMDAPPSGGFNNDEYKTTKLVLRRIDPGSFKMCGEYDVALTKPFYCGIFEVTQRQYELVMGENPCSSTSYGKGDAFPVHYVSYNMIRGGFVGAGWPNSSAVNSTSFLGKLRVRTGLNYDLPTEAQWEYSCRAGTTTTYSYGNVADENYMWDCFNSINYCNKVGTKLPNTWGIYDMHGNVSEWCLDWFGDLFNGVTDPYGSPSGAYRVSRGGYSKCNPDFCTSSSRNAYRPWGEVYYIGFRLVQNVTSCPVIYTVTFDPGEGEVGETSRDVEEDTTVGTLPLPTYSGHSFLGWSTEMSGGEFVNADTIITMNVTYHANWRMANNLSGDFLYCVIDLSAGDSASSYPVTYMDAPPSDGFNTDEYKTTKLVLRRIDPGSFKMGGEYDVTLTKPYYIGIFEVTQRQYELVTGAKPSYFNNTSYYETRPVENISYDMIRGLSLGVNWPSSSAVDASSFMGKLRVRTLISGFDLPTEAQWEFACRAGTTSAYNNGGYYEDDLKLLGRYGAHWVDQSCTTQNGTAEVGSYQPNAWGLYDMHGNVDEWCLDRYGDLSNGVTDPHGPSSGAERVLRGGGYSSYAEECTSLFRHKGYQLSGFQYWGFRLVLLLAE